jgi:hypothetical protein
LKIHGDDEGNMHEEPALDFFGEIFGWRSKEKENLHNKSIAPDTTTALFQDDMCCC